MGVQNSLLSIGSSIGNAVSAVTRSKEIKEEKQIQREHQQALTRKDNAYAELAEKRAKKIESQIVNSDVINTLKEAQANKWIEEAEAQRIENEKNRRQLEADDIINKAKEEAEQQVKDYNAKAMMDANKMADEQVQAMMYQNYGVSGVEAPTQSNNIGQDYYTWQTNDNQWNTTVNNQPVAENTKKEQEAIVENNIPKQQEANTTALEQTDIAQATRQNSAEKLQEIKEAVSQNKTVDQVKAEKAEAINDQKEFEALDKQLQESTKAIEKKNPNPKYQVDIKSYEEFAKDYALKEMEKNRKEAEDWLNNSEGAKEEFKKDDQQQIEIGKQRLQEHQAYKDELIKKGKFDNKAKKEWEEAKKRIEFNIQWYNEDLTSNNRWNSRKQSAERQLEYNIINDKNINSTINSPKNQYLLRNKYNEYYKSQQFDSFSTSLENVLPFVNAIIDGKYTAQNGVEFPIKGARTQELEYGQKIFLKSYRDLILKQIKAGKDAKDIDLSNTFDTKRATYKLSLSDNKDYMDVTRKDKNTGLEGHYKLPMLFVDDGIVGNTPNADNEDVQKSSRKFADFLNDLEEKSKIPNIDVNKQGAGLVDNKHLDNQFQILYKMIKYDDKGYPKHQFGQTETPKGYFGHKEGKDEAIEINGKKYTFQEADKLFKDKNLVRKIIQGKDK